MADDERIKVDLLGCLCFLHFPERRCAHGGHFLAKRPSGRLATHIFFPPRLRPQRCLDPCFSRPRTIVLVRRGFRSAEVSTCYLFSHSHIGNDDGASRPLLKHWLRFLHNWHLLIASPPFESPWRLTKCCIGSRGRPMLSTRFSEPSLVTNIVAF